jgi:hypothetical protein
MRRLPEPAHRTQVLKVGEFPDVNRAAQVHHLPVSGPVGHSSRVGGPLARGAGNARTHGFTRNRGRGGPHGRRECRLRRSRCEPGVVRGYQRLLHDPGSEWQPCLRAAGRGDDLPEGHHGDLLEPDRSHGTSRSGRRNGSSGCDRVRWSCRTNRADRACRTCRRARINWASGPGGANRQHWPARHRCHRGDAEPWRPQLRDRWSLGNGWQREHRIRMQRDSRIGNVDCRAGRPGCDDCHGPGRGLRRGDLSV